MSRYDQTYADWNYLWTEYAPAHDMTGAYVDQGDLARLLKSPTKATACECLESQIIYWFDVGPDCSKSTAGDERLANIAERYGIAPPKGRP